MRHLVACPQCRRQFDAGDRAAGSRFRCSCGAEVVVEAPLPHDAAVVRCSACGAPRDVEAGETACRYCGSSFTVHDRDLDTVCPGCMARVSGAARFCHHCGSPILVGQAVASAGPLACPACPGERLRSRRLGTEALAVSECARCGGLWLDNTVFEIVATHARQGRLGNLGLAASSGLPAGTGAGGTGAAGPAGGPAPAGRLYRPCAVCGALMNRHNYGRGSGVILDICRAHGIWFDLDELPRLLAWLHEGGEERARRRDSEEAQAVARRERLERGVAASLAGSAWDGPSQPEDLFFSLAAVLGEGLRHLFRPR
jgi:Zn-finger nucleic acid-binding protein